MAIKKLSLEDFFEDEELNFTLIGIHTSIEDYRLAYLINTKLNMNLKRKKKDLDFSNKSHFSIFEWLDNKQLITWNLVSNTCKIEAENIEINNGLFKDHTNVVESFYLLPEHKKVNFFLKINDAQLAPRKKLKIISSSPIKRKCKNLILSCFKVFIEGL